MVATGACTARQDEGERTVLREPRLVLVDSRLGRGDITSGLGRGECTGDGASGRSSSVGESGLSSAAWVGWGLKSTQT